MAAPPAEMRVRPGAACAGSGADAGPAPLLWARSGAMALCGPAGGAPRVAPAALAVRAERLLAAIRTRAGPGAALPGDGAALLGERAAILGLARRGRTSPGGSCRLLRARDGWLAVNLARPDDVSLLPAWLEHDAEPGADPWAFLAAALRARRAGDAVARARMMGLAVAEAVAPHAAPRPPRAAVTAPGRAQRAPVGRPRVLDLSSLWAGPLCTHLLAGAGARVVKVESTARPDGARRGPAAFFDLLNAGKASVALDLATARGRDRLRRLADRADVVVEASRPRALRQLGLDAEAWLAARPGRVWTSITGHGRAEPGAGWVAFGDDAAAAAGLAVAAGSRDAPVFCADAVADPLAGLEAAAETLAALVAGGGDGGGLVDVSLVGAARTALDAATALDPAEPAPARVVADGPGWRVECAGQRAAVAPPRARRPAGRARPLGADTEAVLRDWGVPC